MTGRRRFARRLARLWMPLYWLAGGLLLLFLCEGVLRLLPYQPPSSPVLIEFVNPEWNDTLVYQFHPEFFWGFRPNNWIEERRPDGSRYAVRINNLGLRGADFPDPAAEGAYRIMMLGDSCAFGVLTEHGHNLPEQLEFMLERAYPDRRFRIFNAGVTGYSSLQVRLSLEKYGPLFAPHLVLLYAGTNDVLPCMGFSDREIYEKHRGRLRFERLRERSKLFTSLRGLLPAATREAALWLPEEGSGLPPLRVPLPESEENFRAIFDFTRERLGADLAVVQPPNFWPDNPITLVNDILRRLCEEKDVPCVDAYTAFREYPDGPSLMARPDVDLIHPGEKGYRLIAEMLFEAIRERGFVEKSPPLAVGGDGKAPDSAL